MHYDHGIYIEIEWRMMTIEMNILSMLTKSGIWICIAKLVAAQKAHTRKNVSVKMNDCDSLLHFQVSMFLFTTSTFICLFHEHTSVSSSTSSLSSSQVFQCDGRLSILLENQYFKKGLCKKNRSM